MSQRLSELCSLLVENAYGDLAGQIFSILAIHGRMSLTTLRRHSDIPLRRLEAGLTTLVQHHLVLYHAAGPDARTYFQVNLHAAYNLIRLQKVIKIVRDNEGEAAGQLISNILQLGHASVGDLADEYDLVPGSKRDSGIENVEEHMTGDTVLNGFEKSDDLDAGRNTITSVEHFHSILRSLLTKGYIVKVSDRTCMPKADFEERIKDTVVAEHFPDGKITGPKKEKAFQREVNKLKRKWSDYDSFSTARDVESHGVIKRRRASTGKTATVKTKTAKNKTSTAKSSTAKTSKAKTSTAKTSTAKTSTAKTSTAKTSTAKTSTAKTSKDKRGKPDELSNGVDSTDHQPKEAGIEQASTSGSKRRKSDKLSNGVDPADHDAKEAETEQVEGRVDKLPNDMVVHVNFAKITTLFRLQRFEQAAHQFLGSTCAAVYGALLRALEQKSKARRKAGPKSHNSDDEDEGSLVYVTNAEVHEHLDPAIDIGSKYKCVNLHSKQPNGTHNQRSKTKVVVNNDDDLAELGIKKENISDSEGELEVDSTTPVEGHAKRLLLIDMHLKILAEHKRKFCIRRESKSKTTVDLKALSWMIEGIELESMISSRFSKIHMRYIRILREFGRMDVQVLAKMTMALHNPVCELLTALQFAGLANSQEVAKDAKMLTAVSTWLWWFDQKDVADRYLERTYQGMARTLQRIRFERETNFKTAIDKGERVAVRGKENELLNQQDREELRKWQEVEEQLLVQLARMDDLVIVLRDLDGRDTSLMS